MLKMFGKGQVSRGVGRISSLGIADMEDERVRAQLATKYPARGRAMPDTVRKDSPVSNLAGLRDSLQKLEKGVSPGSGGLRPEFLKTLAEVMNDQQMGLLESFGMRYLGGLLPAWFYAVFPSCQTLPLLKNEEGDLRPIGVKIPW